MPGALEHLGLTLLVVAAPIEARAVLRARDLPHQPADNPWTLTPLAPHLELVVSGVGKSAAAAAAARFLDPKRHAAVVSLGVAGALPRSGLDLAQSLAATRSVFADEGFETPSGFTDISSAGFPPGLEDGMGVDADPELLALLRPLVDAAGPVATVSTCSGTDALAHAYHLRTGAIAEAMEGGAVAVTAQRVSPALRFSELRVVSNTTGDRDRQRWDLPLAIEHLGRLAAAL